jgi:hypothetical protein
MSTATQMTELVTLRALLSEVQLTDAQDEIKWKWTASGQYTTCSAYVAQHVGSFCSFDSMAIWKAMTEGKHQFFAWLLVQRKILTADKLIARNWPYNPLYPLCDQVPESADHLCLQCVFSQGVWVMVSQWCNGVVQVPGRDADLETWWNSGMTGVPVKENQQRAALLIYTAWNIGKERNKRIFDEVASSKRRVFQLIKEEMALRASACEVPETTVVY